MPVTTRAPKAVPATVRRASELESASGIGEICRARNVVERLGGRFSVEAGIDIERGLGDLRRWALLAELLSTSTSLPGGEPILDMLERAGENLDSDARFARLLILGEEMTDPVELELAVADLLGWRPRTARVFLRELRGIWHGSDPPLDARAVWGARHAHLPSRARDLIALARDAHLDSRDLEAALIRLALSHRTTDCPGGEECPLVACDAGTFVQF